MTEPLAENRARPALTGAILAKLALEDFAGFFLPGHELIIPLTIGDTSGHASAKSKGSERWIAISRDMADHEIATPATFLFHLLILGHEIAHVVHEHVYAGQQEAKDYSALEFWADFYGAKVAMTLITYDTQICKSFGGFLQAASEKKERLQYLADAIDMMIAGNVYVAHRKYPPPLVRAGLISNGVTSFLRHNMGAAFTPKMYPGIFATLMSGPSVQAIIETDALQTDFSSEPIERIQRWHREMQGDRPAITSHFKVNLLPYLHTTFDQTDKEREMSKRERLAELQAAGFLQDVELGAL